MKSRQVLLSMLGMGAALAITARPEIPYENIPHYTSSGKRNVIQRRPSGKASFKQNKRKGL